MTQPHAVAITSRTEKTYMLQLVDCEPRDLPYSRVGKRYVPRRMRVIKRDGNVSSIVLSGYCLKKDGTEGQLDASERFYSVDAADTPAWVKSIVRGLA